MQDATYSGGALTALFDSRSEAESAADRLRTAGISGDSIRIEGAGDGGATDEAGVLASLSGFFNFPYEDRALYAEGIRRGSCLLCVVDPPQGTRDEVAEILADSGAVDLDERERAWRAEGWAGYAARPASEGGFVPAEGAAESQAGYVAETDETVPIVEEGLRVGKREVSGGRVRVRSYVVEEPVTADVELREERVEIERRPVDQPVASGEDAFRERTIEAEEFTEEPVVSKEARVVEEVGLRREAETRRETVEDTVRHTEVEIDRDDTPDRR